MLTIHELHLCERYPLWCSAKNAESDEQNKVSRAQVNTSKTQFWNEIPKLLIENTYNPALVHFKKIGHGTYLSCYVQGSRKNCSWAPLAHPRTTFCCAEVLQCAQQ